jgi:hypothetical protein
MAAQAGLVVAMVLGGVIAYVATRKKETGEPTLPPPAESAFAPGAYDARREKEVYLAPQHPKPTSVQVSEEKRGAAEEGTDYEIAIDSKAGIVELRFLRQGFYEVVLHYTKAGTAPTYWTFEVL